MKKRSIIMLLTLMLAGMMILPGCSQDKMAKLTGDWHSETCIHEKKEVPTSSVWGNFSMTINDDQSATIDFIGIKSKGNITKNEDGTFNLTTKKFEDITLTMDGDNLTMDFSGDQIIFEKAE